MKKLAISLLLGVACISHAHEGIRHHGYYGGGYYAGNNWIAPAIIGGVIGYELSRPRPVYIEQQPVIIQQPPIVYSQPTIQQPPLGYHWQEMIDPVTNQRKIVLVPN
jgi:hypothetical protein